MSERVKPSHLELDDSMSRAEIADALAKLIFTASHDWQRKVVMDRNVRDLIVLDLRRPRL